MKITVTTQEGMTYPIDVHEDLLIENLKALLSLETNISPSELIIFHNMSPLVRDKDTLSTYGVQDGDILLVARRPQEATPPLSAPAQPQTRSHTAHNTGMRLPAIDWSSVHLSQSSNVVYDIILSHVVLFTGGQQVGQNSSSFPLSPSGDPESFTPEALIQHFLANPEELLALQQRSPQLAEAIASGDINWVREGLLLHRQQLIVSEL